MMKDINWKFWQSTRCSYHRSAQKEFIYTLLISLSPIVAASFGFWLSDDTSAYLAINKVIGNGELIIYAATLMAPVVYSTQKDPPIFGKDYFFIFCSLIVAVGVLYYAFYAGGLIKQDVFVFSIGISFISLLVYYISLFYEHRAELATSSPELHNTLDKQFQDNFRNYMEGDK